MMAYTHTHTHPHPHPHTHTHTPTHTHSDWPGPDLASKLTMLLQHYVPAVRTYTSTHADTYCLYIQTQTGNHIDTDTNTAISTSPSVTVNHRLSLFSAYIPCLLPQPIYLNYVLCLSVPRQGGEGTLLFGLRFSSRRLRRGPVFMGPSTKPDHYRPV